MISRPFLLIVTKLEAPFHAIFINILCVNTNLNLNVLLVQLVLRNLLFNEFKSRVTETQFNIAGEDQTQRKHKLWICVKNLWIFYEQHFFIIKWFFRFISSLDIFMLSYLNFCLFMFSVLFFTENGEVLLMFLICSTFRKSLNPVEARSGERLNVLVWQHRSAIKIIFLSLFEKLFRLQVSLTAGSKQTFVLFSVSPFQNKLFRFMNTNSSPLLRHKSSKISRMFFTRIPYK